MTIDAQVAGIVAHTYVVIAVAGAVAVVTLGVAAWPSACILARRCKARRNDAA